MDKFRSFGRHGARKLPKIWRSLQGWQRLSPRRSRKPWVLPLWSGIACRLVEQGQHSVRLLVMDDGLLSYARPGKLLRMRQCDLVPPLRGALQNFSIILAAEETGRPTKVRTFNDTLELDGPLKNPLCPFTYPTLCRFSSEDDNKFDAAIKSTLPMETFWPVNRHSRRLSVAGASQNTRTMASHENCPTIREALPLRTKLGIPARKSPTASPGVRRTARGCVARRPAHGSPGTSWSLLKGHFAALGKCVMSGGNRESRQECGPEMN